MTIRDPEVLEALRDEPELLALADAVTETQKVVHPSRRRALSRVGALAAVGATVLLALMLWPSGSGRNGILDRALAAIGNGPILHLVVLAPTGQELVNLQTGRTVVPKSEMESWTDRSLTRLHVILRRHGRIVGEFVGNGNASVGTIDPSYAALWSGYRQALASGQAKIEGTGSLFGHLVYWLVFRSHGTEVAIDRSTYKPVAFRSSFVRGEPPLDTRVLLARTQPLTASTFRRRTTLPDPFFGAGSGSVTQIAPVSPSRSSKPWLSAGDAIAGLKLSAVHELQTKTNGKRSRGFELRYGREGGVQRTVTIEESRHSTDPSRRRTPSGFVNLVRGQGSDQDNHSYPLWTGYLERDGVFVTITTGVSRAALLEAARALRP